MNALSVIQFAFKPLRTPGPAFYQFLLTDYSTGSGSQARGPHPEQDRLLSHERPHHT